MDVLSAMAVFARVIELQSFSLAASDLGVSSSSVSKQVAHLEKHVGAALLERTTRRLKVTEAGEAYYEKCQQILSQVEEAEALVTQFQGNPHGVLKVNSDIAFGTALLARAVPEFLVQYPDIQLEVMLDDGAVGPLQQGFDLAFRVIDFIQPSEALVVHELACAPQVICATPEYIARHGQLQVPADLENHNCLGGVSLGKANRWVFNGIDGSQEIQIASRLRANSSLMLQAVMLAHQGVCRLSGFEACQLIEEGRVRLLLADYEVKPCSLFAIYPAHKYKNMKADLFIKFLEGWITANVKNLEKCDQIL
ncbi:LysR family transcriptional regulator [Amphritea japonica]|uniref:LysR family transcriptional regulator n=1 Tax=Amphritea japonica ATCC BAA-1530 TaxID=1278309 RepID=A0A7R6PMG6_9GAMM|nr:LysR family transcriptional regulator [Amphritea japonica]BBB26113.1 LysR family transcriptional regulator [Amphritea japonica ATCC BAA-1530]